jgi:hypothetical protein
VHNYQGIPRDIFRILMDFDPNSRAHYFLQNRRKRFFGCSIKRKKSEKDRIPKEKN